MAWSYESVKAAIVAYVESLYAGDNDTYAQLRAGVGDPGSSAPYNTVMVGGGEVMAGQVWVGLPADPTNPAGGPRPTAVDNGSIPLVIKHLISEHVDWAGSGHISTGPGLAVFDGSGEATLLPMSVDVLSPNDMDVLTYDASTGTWGATSVGANGVGNVVGPVSTTDNTVARFDGSTGTKIQSSLVLIDDSGNLTTPGTINGRNLLDDGMKLDGIEPGADKTDAANVSGAGAVMRTLYSAKGTLLAAAGNLDPRAVPAPVGDPTATYVLTWAPAEVMGVGWRSPSGVGLGDVSGPGSATDNAVARFDQGTGKLIQNSLVTIDDAGNISTPGTVNGRNMVADGNKLNGIEAGADKTDADNVKAAGAVMYEDYPGLGAIMIGTTAGDATTIVPLVDGQIIISDLSQPTGWSVQTLASAALPITTKGDLIGHDGVEAVRVARGPKGSVLEVDPSQPSALRWRTPISKAMTDMFLHAMMG